MEKEKEQEQENKKEKEKKTTVARAFFLNASVSNGICLCRVSTTKITKSKILLTSVLGYVALNNTTSSFLLQKDNHHQSITHPK